MKRKTVLRIIVPVFHLNNLKGIIQNIEETEESIVFDIEIDTVLNELDTFGYSFELLGNSENGKSKENKKGEKVEPMLSAYQDNTQEKTQEEKREEKQEKGWLFRQVFMSNPWVPVGHYRPCRRRCRRRILRSFPTS